MAAAAAVASAPALQSRNSCCCFLRSSIRPTRNISRSLFFCFSISTVGGQSQWVKAHKFERNPAKYWDEFYQRHRNKFFKDRHYLEKDWGHCFTSDSSTEVGETSVSTKIVLEVGCGAGNSLFPLVAAFPNVFVHACDFSPHAISLIKAHEAYRSNKVNAFVCDLTVDDLCKMIMPASIDVLTMIFMLSAVPPSMMPLVLHNAKNVLKPNGYLLFRDYAIGDYAQEKLANKDQMISENFYVRGDGTCAFYFSEDSLTTLFQNNGFSALDVNVYYRQIVNRSRNVVMDRRWIRATFSPAEDIQEPG